MTASRTKKVAPDGGWAWMVCFGVSMVNFSTRSLEPSFGLLFGDLLKSLNIETTGASIIMSTLDCVVNFSGFLVGPILKTFSYRKVCIVGSFISATGLMLTTPSTSITHILVTYSIMGGLGVGLASSASFVSLNHYFSKKRGQAVGLSMTGTGFGMMIMPQLVRILVDAYGFRGAILVLSGLAFHSVLGSCLLQPVEWHLKKVSVDEEMLPVKEKNTDNGAEEVNLLNSHPNSKAESFFQRFINLTDMGLLKDRSYLNLVFGLSIYWAGEFNFGILLPFFIGDMGYSKGETAFCLSVSAISDILVRLTLPPLFDRGNIPRKLIFIIGCTLVAVARSVLAMQTEWVSLMVWLLICGFFRGICMSNYNLTISEFCSLEKLPAAYGLNMVCRGVFVLVIGPILGCVRDTTASYPLCILAQNALIMCCAVTLATEYAMNFFQRRKPMHI